MTYTLTEAYLSRMFESIIRNKSRNTFAVSFPHLFKELNSAQGKPDYVVSPTRLRIKSGIRRHRVAKAISKPSSATILSLLKKSAPRTEKYLIEQSRFTHQVIKYTLADLQALRLIRKSGKSSYFLAESFPNTDFEMWAFELKIANWQRALYQTLQYKSFAHREYVVISELRANRVERHIDKFRILNVGLLTFDEEKNSLRLIYKPRKHKPTSRYHYIYTLGKFLDAAHA